VAKRARIPCQSSSPRLDAPGTPPRIISDLCPSVPVTEAEIRLIMAVLGPHIAEILNDE
jgi:hypothetical protein